MQLKRYCVTVMDNWAPIKFFWTRSGAADFINAIPAAGTHVRLYQWAGRKWQEIDWTRYAQ
jgi:hypothetical protein